MEARQPGNRGITGNLAFDTMRPGRSFDASMTAFAKLTYRLLGAAALFLLVVPAEAGEKIRFGSHASTMLATLPAANATPRELETGHNFNNPKPVQIMPSDSGAGASVTVRPRRQDDEDERNWIFRDAQSATAVQKALGVETFEPPDPTRLNRDSVQEYFGRQQSQGAAAAQAPAVMTGQTGLPEDPFRASEPSPRPGPLPASASTLFGGASFRNTLNSENAAVRNYYRRLYTDPDSGSFTGAATPLPTTPAPATPDPSTQPPSFSELAGRAAFVNSLTPDTPFSPTLNPAPAVPANNSASGTLPTVNNGKLFERRNGLIEIPGRKF